MPLEANQLRLGANEKIFLLANSTKGKRKHNFVECILIFITILIKLGEQYTENVTYDL